MAISWKTLDGKSLFNYLTINSSNDFNNIFVGCRNNETTDYASDFHLYRIEWLVDRIEFYIDDQLMNVTIKSPKIGEEYLQRISWLPPNSNAPSDYGREIAPFDAPV